jgi:threonine synthase
MPTDTLTSQSPPSGFGAARTDDTAGLADDGSAAVAAPRIRGLRCKNCQRPEPLGPSYVCPACFGPLEVAYDYDVIRGLLDRDTIAARPAGIWRYLELLPVDAPPARGLAVGSTPLVPADRLGREIGIERLWIKDDTRNPTLSFKDRVVAVATARAVEFGADTLACASTGNLAGATAAAAAAAGLRAFVFIPADLEQAKIDHALAYGATVVPIQGTYDDVNRLSMEVADELGWAFVNVTLRPFYAEGSKSLAFEIAESLGWRLPDAIVAPVASGSLFTKVAKGIDELVAIGLVEPRPVKFIGGQAAGCSPVASAFADGSDVIRPVRQPDTIVRSLAIGSPADGRYALELARRTSGSIEAIPDEVTAEAIRTVAATEGVFSETAGGVTVAAAQAARVSGVIRADDEVVVLLTGNGLKTPDARTFGLAEDAAGARRARAGEPGLAPVLPPSLSAFEGWLQA